MKKLKRIYYLIGTLYNVGITIWSATIYLFMYKIGYTYGQINLFLSIFWIVTFLAEIPSGFIADHFGYLRTIQISGLVRGGGLLLLALSPKSIVLMVFSGFLTALGDSLQSGTLSSWIANKAITNNEKDQLGSIYSFNGIISTAVSMLVGFIGAHFLANIGLNLPLIVGAIVLFTTSLMIIPLLKYDTNNLNQSSKTKKLKNMFLETKKVIRKETTTFRLIWIFLPILIISSGPLDQWQLYFQHGRKIKTGSILVAMNLLGMLGSYIYRITSKRKLKQINVIIFSTLLMALTIVFSVITEKFYYISILFFLVHTLFGSIEQLSQETVLQQSITVESSRASIISVRNAVEAGISVVILSINGYLSDKFGVGVAWITLAVVGLGIFCINYMLNKKAVKTDGK